MSLASTAFTIQRQLFPMLEEEIGPLSDQEQRPEALARPGFGVLACAALQLLQRLPG